MILKSSATSSAKHTFAVVLPETRVLYRLRRNFVRPLPFTTFFLFFGRAEVVSSEPSSVAMKDGAVTAHRGVERQFVIYCLEINCLLLKPPPCTDYGNSVTGAVIDGQKVALINCFVC